MFNQVGNICCDQNINGIQSDDMWEVGNLVQLQSSDKVRYGLSTDTIGRHRPIADISRACESLIAGRACRAYK